MAGTKSFKIILLAIIFVLSPRVVFALEIDSDKDGLDDETEMNIYHTNPNSSDTDNDGFSDGEEVKFNFDPNRAVNDRLEKRIEVSLKDQALTYFLGPYSIKAIKISRSGSGYRTFFIFHYYFFLINLPCFGSGTFIT